MRTCVEGGCFILDSQVVVAQQGCCHVECAYIVLEGCDGDGRHHDFEAKSQGSGCWLELAVAQQRQDHSGLRATEGSGEVLGLDDIGSIRGKEGGSIGLIHNHNLSCVLRGVPALKLGLMTHAGEVEIAVASCKRSKNASVWPTAITKQSINL